VAFDALRLSEEVGEQNLVVLAAGDGVERLSRGEEVTAISGFERGRPTMG